MVIPLRYENRISMKMYAKPMRFCDVARRVISYENQISAIDMAYIRQIGVGGRGAPVHGLRIDPREGGAGWAGLSSVRPFVRM